MATINMKTIYWAMCNAECVLNKLTEGLYHVNNDFNGTNGEEFTSEEAIEAGYKSDMEYVRAQILEKNRNKRLSLDDVVQMYLSALFADYYSYEWNYDLHDHPVWGSIGVTVAWKNID